jgi:hypothetical protein
MAIGIEEANFLVMYCMRAQIQNMNNEGSIVNASSIAGIQGFPKNAAYTASKHGRLPITYAKVFYSSTWQLSSVYLDRRRRR